ncbi:MAG: hypothetical protein KJZ65_08200 [Phycisphaerales bacterium]|nr:hypothetical protein [Phycisphaerales bacterium]
MPEIRRMTEDERYEQAMSAAASERRNRPKHLLLIPLLLFCVAGLVLAFALFSRETARLRLEQQEMRYARLVEGVVQLREINLKSAASNGQNSLGEPISDLLSRMETYATQAGLQEKPRVPQQRKDSTRGAVRQRYIYSGLTDRSLPALLDWLRIAQNNVPGLFVYSITLRPVPSRGWSMDVTFARWEREVGS